jgi:type IV pilus assembly protein PilE
MFQAYARATGGTALQYGITLIELMIVLVVVGILASIAYPSYQEYILRSRRTEGKAMLMDVVARLERHYMNQNSYTTDLTELGFSSASPTSAEGKYQASVAAGPSGDIETSYTVTVSPQWPGGDGKCGNLTLDSRGTKGSETGDAAQCWR